MSWNHILVSLIENRHKRLYRSFQQFGTVKKTLYKRAIRRVIRKVIRGGQVGVVDYSLKLLLWFGCEEPRLRLEGNWPVSTKRTKVSTSSSVKGLLFLVGLCLKYYFASSSGPTWVVWTTCLSWAWRFLEIWIKFRLMINRQLRSIKIRIQSCVSSNFA